MDMWISKLISLILLFLLTLIFGVIPPLCVDFVRKRNRVGNEDDQAREQAEGGRRAKAEVVLSYLNCFAGGVFLGTCLMHLFPEVEEKFDDIKDLVTFKVVFPLSNLTIAGGFFLIMIIEHAAKTIHGRYQLNNRRAADEQPNERTPILGRAAGAENPQYAHGQTPVAIPPDPDKITTLRSLLLLLALSLHTAFEGLALGLETTPGHIWILFAALAVHKSVIAVSLGLQFADTFEKPSKSILFIFIFSLVCPIGVAIGIGVSSLNTQSLGYLVTNMCLQGLATGTFLYVTFFEVLHREMAKQNHSMMKVLVVIAGFAMISLSTFIEGLAE